MKYKNYEDLMVAYRKGKLNREESPLMVDNDTCIVLEDDRVVFRGNGSYDYCTLLSLLGIPWENV